jgi:hypothetical protein
MAGKGLSIDDIAARAVPALAEHAAARVSEKYKFIPTTDIIDAMREADFEPVRAMGVRSRVEERRNFGKHQIAFRHGSGFGAEVNDVFPEIILRNSHDGVGAFVLTAGVFRLVCSNGMVVGQSVDQMRVSHRTKSPLEDIVARSLAMANQFGVLAGTIEQAKGIEMSHADQLMFARRAIALRFPQDDENAGPRLDPSVILEARRVEDRGNDVWTVFNRVQEHLVRGGNVMTMANGRQRRMRELTRMETNFDFNRGLWDLFDEAMVVNG